MLAKILFWSILVAALVGAGWWLLTRSRTRRRQEQLWGALEGEPALPKWNQENLGISAVRVQGTPEPRERQTVASHTPEPEAAPLAASPADAAPAEPERHEEASPEASGEAPPSAPPPAAADAMPPSATPTPSPDPTPYSPEWWGNHVETGALLRALVEATGGSAALLRPDPSDGGFLVLAAAGDAADTLHAREGLHRLGDIRLLEDLPRDLSTTVFGGDEAGLLPGLAPEAVGETAVRALAPAPAPRRLLVADVPADAPLEPRAEHLFGLYADLLARVHDLPLTPPPPEPDPAPSDPVEGVMEQLGVEIASAREHGRPLAFALVAPADSEAMTEADPEAVAEAEAELRQRLEDITGTRAVLPMGALAFAAICEADAFGAERWVNALASGDTLLHAGIAVYGPRHVSPALLRQEAAHALHQTYTTDDAFVIVE